MRGWGLHRATRLAVAGSVAAGLTMASSTVAPADAGAGTLPHAVFYGPAQKLEYVDIPPGGNGWALFTANVDGTGVTQVSPTGHLNPTDGFSPDGSSVVYVVDSGSTHTITVANVDGTGTRPLTQGTDPAWSPDGSNIVYSTPDAKLAIIRPDGSGQRTFQAPLTGTLPQWAPDSRTVIETPTVQYPDNSFHTDVVSVDTVTDTVTTLVHNGLDHVYATYSPTGANIAYGEGNFLNGSASSSATAVYIAAANGSGGVLASGGLVTGEIQEASQAWSPDGGTFLFSGRTSSMSASDPGAIESFNLATGTRRDLGPGDNPTFDPSGSSIVFSSGKGIAGANPDGSGRHPIVGSIYSAFPRLSGAAGTSGCTPRAANPPPTGPVSRIAGSDRDATGVAISKASFAKDGSAKAVVLSTDAQFPDALAGGPLAVNKTGPLLVTTPAGLNPAVEQEIKRVLPSGATVYVLGGNLAVAPSVDSQLQSDGFVVTRVSGPDRFATAVAIADLMGSPTTVFEVTGLDFPDALSAGPAAASHGAILLTNGSNQHPTTSGYLAAHAGTRYAIGGPASTADPQATSIVGADRYDTAVAVAQKFFTAPATLAFASGAGFADALTGGPAAGVTSSPLLLVRPCGPLPASLGPYLSATKSSVKAAALFGGVLAVGDDVLGELDTALT